MLGLLSIIVQGKMTGGVVHCVSASVQGFLTILYGEGICDVGEECLPM